MKGITIRIFANDRGTPQVYLYVVSYRYPVYIMMENLWNLPSKWCATWKNREQNLFNSTFNVMVQFLHSRAVIGIFLMMEECLIKDA